MSFQAYLDTIKAKTGKDPDYFLAIAKEKGLLNPTIQISKIIEWLAKDYGLGHGHAMSLIVTFKDATLPKETIDEQLAKHFSGNRAAWKQPYGELRDTVTAFGNDVSVKLGGTYISLLRSGRKFAIVQITGSHMDIGIKRKNAATTERFRLAGPWNSMVTHRVQITDPDQIDQEVISWLRAAYDAA